jgi:hypothetical protein
MWKRTSEKYKTRRFLLVYVNTMVLLFQSTSRLSIVRSITTRCSVSLGSALSSVNVGWFSQTRVLVEFGVGEDHRSSEPVLHGDDRQKVIPILLYSAQAL